MLMDKLVKDNGQVGFLLLVTALLVTASFQSITNNTVQYLQKVPNKTALGPAFSVKKLKQSKKYDFGQCSNLIGQVDELAEVMELKYFPVFLAGNDLPRTVACKVPA